MFSTAPHAVRFREARERAGLSPEVAAERMGISRAWLWDIECCDDELTNNSPAEIRRYCEVLGIRARELFGIELATPPITATDLAVLIREHCRSHGITIAQFEDAAGWSVSVSLDHPERFMGDDYCIEGIQDICRELDTDWQRFILSL